MLSPNGLNSTNRYVALDKESEEGREEVVEIERVLKKWKVVKK